MLGRNSNRVPLGTGGAAVRPEIRTQPPTFCDVQIRATSNTTHISRPLLSAEVQSASPSVTRLKAIAFLSPIGKECRTRTSTAAAVLSTPNKPTLPNRDIIHPSRDTAPAPAGSHTASSHIHNNHTHNNNPSMFNNNQLAEEDLTAPSLGTMPAFLYPLLTCFSLAACCACCALEECLLG